MVRRPRAALAALAIVLGGLASPNAARADERQECLAAAERAQQLRNAGRLSEAREQLVTCGRTVCPRLVQQDCTEWMKEVLATLPSIVPAAKDGRGRDVVDVKVSIDGKVVTETLDGKALDIDPGVHALRFEARGAPPVEEKIVVRQGEKNRIVAVTLAEPPPTGTPPPPPSVPRPAEGPSPPVAGYVVGGVGLAALGAALFVALDANADAEELRTTCAPSCEQARIDDIADRRLVAGVTAALGGAALVAGVVLILTHDRGRSARSSWFVPGIGMAAVRF